MTAARDLWAVLPPEVREEVDAWVVRRGMVQAIHVVRSSREGAGTGIHAGVDLVAWRMEVLGDRVEPLPADDLETLAGRARELPGGPPAALRLEWDGDSWGWMLVLRAVLDAGDDRPPVLAVWRGTDWAEPPATAAALAGRLGVPLHGPGDDGPAGWDG
ncbi:hypothetical protein ACGFMM_16970 [Streptomyces sp. NPDC048604]|uniref:hypothetical protein n=1 Tax=Streptomyces sp. NPDC048604 TaxID=3365578 RepID=UPI0037177C2A